MPPPSARCSRHPAAPAVDVCQRCGAFVCGECVNIRAEDIYCPACVPFLDRPASPRSARALISALVGPVVLLTSGFGPTPARLLGAPLFLLASAIALALLLQERAARHRKQAPAKGFLYPLAWLAIGLDALLLVGLLAIIQTSGWAA